MNSKFNTKRCGCTLPSILGFQRRSFCWFLEKGLLRQLYTFSSVKSSIGSSELNFITRQYRVEAPEASLLVTQARNKTYGIPIFLRAVYVDSSSQAELSGEVSFSQIPLLLNSGYFIINGLPRVIVSQIVRSPGISYKIDHRHKGIAKVVSVVSSRGSWLKVEIDEHQQLMAQVDTSKKFPIYVFLRALGMTTNEILEALYQTSLVSSHVEKSIATLLEDADPVIDGSLLDLEEECLFEVYRCLRPDSSPSVSAARQLLHSKIFDPKNYDLGTVGRYRLNKRLGVSVARGVHILTIKDIISLVNFLVVSSKLARGSDSLDHLGNKRVRAIGELLSNQVGVGLARLSRLMQNRLDDITEALLEEVGLGIFVNPQVINISVREFFSSNPLSQFMDQINPLAEVTHKRRISGLGVGGLTRERTTVAVRNIHPSQFGRICPIETPEGPNVGIVSSPSNYARCNNFGFLETPFYRVVDGKVLKNFPPIYIDSFFQEQVVVAAGDTQLTDDNRIYGDYVVARYKGEFTLISPDRVDYVEVSPIQILALGVSLVPFLEHNDGNRALMGSNMQRQSVPLMYANSPLIGTGLEAQVATGSCRVLLTSLSGKVVNATGNRVTVKDRYGSLTCYDLVKYQRSNQDTFIDYRPLVCSSEKVYPGQVLADGSAIVGGELAIGQNIIIGYMGWEGYNYEDAFIISERLVHDDVYTSIHIEKFQVSARTTPKGEEKITRDIPYVDKQSLSKLDENGVVCVGSWVEPGDILVGRVSPKEDDELPEQKLVRAIFGEKYYDVEDTSLRLEDATVSGRVLSTKVFSGSDNPDQILNDEVVVLVFLGQLRRIRVGDKVAGRHGNKGIIARILPRQDMPFLPTGEPADILLNPLGVPSRMNVGQLFEALLGFTADYLNVKMRILPFDEYTGRDASKILVKHRLDQLSAKSPWLFNFMYPGKLFLTDGQTGAVYENPVTVGCAYVLKLVHLVDDKIHARSTGPYSQITQQPVGGRSRNGGQRLGEMEVWALEAYGAAFTLYELLTLKSDDIQGRSKVIHSILLGYAMPRPKVPESVKLLFRELQSLCLDISAYQLDSSDPVNNTLFQTYKEVTLFT